MYTCLYVVFVYLKLRCLGFLCAPCASSVYPNFEGCHEAPDGPGGGVSLFILLSNPQGYRHGEMSKAATCRIGLTLNCLLSWVTVWLRFSSRSSLYSYHTDPFSDSGNRVFLHCLHSCQTVWTHSHDEFTPLCSYLYVCVDFVTVQVCSTR